MLLSPVVNYHRGLKKREKCNGWQIPPEIKLGLNYATHCQESCKELCGDRESKWYRSLRNMGDLSFARTADLPEQYTGSTAKRPH